MDIEMGEIARSGDNTQFIVLADGQPYTFTIPNAAIHAFHGKTDIDCQQFVIEYQELFQNLATELIAGGAGPGPIVIDHDLLTSYVQ